MFHLSKGFGGKNGDGILGLASEFFEVMQHPVQERLHLGCPAMPAKRAQKAEMA
jgi:hypothetical protein